jgi:tetratricopeptide (TPR) repeat protein
MDTKASDTVSERAEHDRGAKLVDGFQSFIKCDDEAGLRHHLKAAWSLGDLTSLLHHEDGHVRRIAAACLGARGGRGAVLPLVAALRDDDPVLAAAAEDALWRLWFTAAGNAARGKLMRSVQLIEQGRFDAVIATLDDLIEREPEFAEAYHQRGTARYLRGDLLAAIADYKHAVRLEPCHFGALAGLARAHADLGQDVEALAAYEKSLYVHPRLSCVPQAVRTLRNRLRRRDPVSCDE